MSGTEAAAAAAAAVAYVSELISNILDRVPDLVLLFRCSLVCKQWRGIVTDPDFLRRRGIRPEREGGQPQSSSLIGFFVQSNRLRDNDFPTHAPVLVSAPGSALRPQRRLLTTFVRDADGDDGILRGASPLAARDGLLLVRIASRSTDDDDSSAAILRLCVCNLLTGGRDLLPALDATEAFDDGGVYGYALLTAADHGAAAAAGPHDDGRYSALFQVFVVGRGHGGNPHVYRFSSSAASGDGWDALDCLPPLFVAREPLWGPYASCVAAVARRTAHWLFCGDGDGGGAQRLYTLNVSAGTGQVSMTALPADAVAAMIQAAGGAHTAWWLCATAEGRRLALLCVENDNRPHQLVMMKQRRDGGGGEYRWDAGHVAQVDVDVDDIEEELGFGEESLSIVCVGERSGTALALC